MKFVLNEKEVVDKLMLASEVCGNESDFMISVLDDKIKVKSKDYNLDFETFIPCYDIQDGNVNIIVKAGYLAPTIKDLGDGIEFELTSKVISDGTSRGSNSENSNEEGEDYENDGEEDTTVYELNYTAPASQNERGTMGVYMDDDVDDDNNSDGTNFFEINRILLCSMIDKTQFAVATSDVRTFLQGIRMVQDNDNFVLIASDGSRMSMVQNQIANMPQFEPATVPTKSIKFFKKLLDKSVADTVKLSIENKSVVLIVDDIKVTSGLINEFYPDYKKILNKEYTHHVKVNNHDLYFALNRFARTVAKKEKRVIFSIKDGKLKLEASEDGKTSEREIDCELQIDRDKEGGVDLADNFDFRLNYQFVLDVLRVLKTEKVQVNFRQEPNTAISFVEQSDDSAYQVMDFHMVMPLKF